MAMTAAGLKFAASGDAIWDHQALDKERRFLIGDENRFSEASTRKQNPPAVHRPRASFVSC